MININGREWEILLVSPFHPTLRRSDGNYTLGVCDDLQSAIYITKDLKLEYLKKVLGHELTHAVMFSYGIDLSYEQEEVFADLIATYGQEIVYKTNLIFQQIKEKREV